MKEKPKTLHEHHRQRLRNVFERGGFGSMEPHQVLELMLFYAIPRKDTNPLAHKLINTFGSLPAVLDADLDDLMSVDGIGQSTAIYLKLFRDVFRVYERSKVKTAGQFRYVSDFGRYLGSMFEGATQEEAFLMCLDASYSIINTLKVSEGTENSVVINYRKVVELSLRNHAVFVILAHNHPGSTPLPSSDDIKTTLDVQRILNGLGIIFLDHLIFSGDEFISMGQSKYISSVLTDITNEECSK